MSEKYPECPLIYSNNCKDYNNPEICAFVRKDKICTKKQYLELKRQIKLNSKKSYKYI